MQKCLFVIGIISSIFANSAAAEVICNANSKITNLRVGPSAKNYDIAATLKNGDVVTVLQRVTNPDGYDYLKVEYSNPATNQSSVAYVYHESVSDSCGEEPVQEDSAELEEADRIEQQQRNEAIWRYRQYIKFMEVENDPETARGHLRKITPDMEYLLPDHEKVPYLVFKGIELGNEKRWVKALEYFGNVIDIKNPNNFWGVTYRPEYDIYMAEAYFQAGSILFNKDISGAIGRHDEKLGRNYIHTAANMGNSKAAKLIKESREQNIASQQSSSPSNSSTSSNSKWKYPCTSCNGSRRWAATFAAGNILTCYRN